MAETVRILNLDEEGDPPVEVPQCFACKNILEYNAAFFEGIVKEERVTCRAFPGGIPEEVLSGEFDHSNAYAGDSGIRFEPVEE